MTLKERLDAVWNDPHVCSPCHLNRWREVQVGYTWFGKYQLYWVHGTPRAPKYKRPKGKGFATWLCKNYGAAWRWQNRPKSTF